MYNPYNDLQRETNNKKEYMERAFEYHCSTLRDGRHYESKHYVLIKTDVDIKELISTWNRIGADRRVYTLVQEVPPAKAMYKRSITNSTIHKDQNLLPDRDFYSIQFEVQEVQEVLK